MPYPEIVGKLSKTWARVLIVLSWESIVSRADDTFRRFLEFETLSITLATVMIVLENVVTEPPRIGRWCVEFLATYERGQTKV